MSLLNLCSTAQVETTPPQPLLFSLSSTSFKKNENLNSPQLDILFYPTFFLDILFCLVVVYILIVNFLFKKKLFFNEKLLSLFFSFFSILFI